MQARYYDPLIGRFYSNDPVGFTGAVDTFNRYSYVGNNPYKYTDPTGMTKEFDELMEKRKQEKRDECNKNPNCSGTSSRVITREVSGKLYNVKMYRCGTAECVASGANIPYEGNEKYFNALNNKAVDDGKVALTAISITTGIGGLYLTSARLHALAFGSASLNASITPNQDNFASMVLTGANPFLAKIHPTIAVGVSSYQVLIEAGVVIDDR